MLYFDDVTGTNDAHSASCIAHERPYGELAGDLASRDRAPLRLHHAGPLPRHARHLRAAQ